MKQKRAKKKSWLSMKIDAATKKRITDMATRERRSISDQATYLMEQGLSALEQKTAPQPAKEPEAV